MQAKNWILSILKSLTPIRLEKQSVNVIYEDDIEKLLTNLGLIENLEKGNILCEICGTRITKENLQCIFSIEGEIKFCCNDLECYRKALEIAESKGNQI